MRVKIGSVRLWFRDRHTFNLGAHHETAVSGHQR
jgi:hypothetical protein